MPERLMLKADIKNRDIFIAKLLELIDFMANDEGVIKRAETNQDFDDKLKEFAIDLTFLRQKL